LKELDILEYASVGNTDGTIMPRGSTYVFTGLFKRGKSYGASRWNPTGDTSRTLYLDAERCVLRFKEYNGMTTLPLTSFTIPKDEKGTPIPPEKRGYSINGKPIKSWSLKEAIALIRVMANRGLLQEKFDIVVLDTLDVLQKWSEEYFLAEYNKTKEPKDQVFSLMDVGGGHGAAWSDARDVLVRPLLELREIVTGMNVDMAWLIHSKTTTQVANKFQRDPALRAGVTNALFGEADAIGYIDVEDSNLPDGSLYGCVHSGILHTVSFVTESEILTGGSRLGPLVGKTLPFSYQAAQEEYRKSITQGDTSAT